jgi:hypothetical protein
VVLCSLQVWSPFLPFNSASIWAFRRWRDNSLADFRRRYPAGQVGDTFHPTPGRLYASLIQARIVVKHDQVHPSGRYAPGPHVAVSVRVMSAIASVDLRAVRSASFVHDRSYVDDFVSAHLCTHRSCAIDARILHHLMWMTMKMQHRSGLSHESSSASSPVCCPLRSSTGWQIERKNQYTRYSILNLTTRMVSSSCALRCPRSLSDHVVCRLSSRRGASLCFVDCSRSETIRTPNAAAADSSLRPSMIARAKANHSHTNTLQGERHACTSARADIASHRMPSRRRPRRCVSCRS